MVQGACHASPSEAALPRPFERGSSRVVWGGGGAQGLGIRLVCLLAAPIGLSPLLILTLCGPERVLVVSTEPPDDLSCLTTPGGGRPGDVAPCR